MTITAEVSYATGGHSGRLESITAEVSYATGGHSGRLVTITAEVSSLLKFYMLLELIQNG